MTTISVSETYDGYPVRGYLQLPSGPSGARDVILLYHGTISKQATTPLDAASKFLEIASDPGGLALDDRILFSVAYPQDAIPGWTQQAAEALFPGINLSTFYLGDNLPYAKAALDWALNSIDTYLAGQGSSLRKARVFAFGHSQGAYLMHRINRLVTIDGVVMNAPGPIDLLGRCAYSEANGDENSSCLAIKTAFGSTTGNPAKYESISMRSYLNGLRSPSLYTQALDDFTVDQQGNPDDKGAPQVKNMQTVVQPALEACSDCAPRTFRYYATGGHDCFVVNADVQNDIRQFLTTATLDPIIPPSPGGGGGSDPSSASGTRRSLRSQITVRGNGIAGISRDFGRLDNLNAVMRGVLGAQSGSQTLFFRATLNGPADVRIRKLPGNPREDQYIRVGVIGPGGKSLPLDPSGFAYRNDLANTERREDTEPLPAGRYVFTVSSSQWQAIPYAVALQVIRYKELAGSAVLAAANTLRLALAKLLGSAGGSGLAQGTITTPATIDRLSGSASGSAALSLRLVKLGGTASGSMVPSGRIKANFRISGTASGRAVPSGNVSVEGGYGY